MKLAEHYLKARSTKNLESNPRTQLSPSDILGAAGMAAQESADAMLMWGVFFGGNSHNMQNLVSNLSYRLTKRMLAQRWKGDSECIVKEVIAHYLYAKCESCDGVGYQVIPETITRYDDPCPDCEGTGKPPTPNNLAWQWLHRYVSGLLSIAAKKTLDKLDLGLT